MDKRTLYKEDSQGTLRFWSIWTEGNEVVQEYGVVDGKPIENRKECEAKNVGKKNERTPEEQAESEAQSKIDKKLDKAYFETKEKALNKNVILPMKAKDYEDHEDKIEWDDFVAAQMKLDGMRALARIDDGDVKLISRQGKEIENMEHVISDLEKIDDTIILDGELYAHGKTFQENMKLIKKYREGETEDITFWVYDCFVNAPYEERHEEITNLLQDKVLNEDFNNVSFLRYKEIDDEGELQAAHSQHLKIGYEGTMIRHGNDVYKENTRDSQLLKYKDFIDIACNIKDVISADARPEQGVLLCENDDGQEFKANLKFSHDKREEVLNNKDDYIGETAEIRYFEETDDGLPRFPVCVGFRLDK